MQKSKFTDVKVDMVTHLEESREQIVVADLKNRIETQSQIANMYKYLLTLKKAVNK